MTGRKIHFQGCGLVSPLGNNATECAGRLHRAGGRPEWIEIRPKDEPVPVPYFPIAAPGIDTGPARIETIIDRAVDEALSDAALAPDQVRDAGLFVGSTSFNIHAAEHMLKSAGSRLDDMARRIPPHTGPTRHIAERHRIGGPVYTFNTACTAGANALLYAVAAIRRGQIEHALVVGLELFNEMTLLGFSSLDLLSPDAMRPFAADGGGMILGEACGAVVLSAEPAAHGFGCLGGANLADHFGITACNPDGSSVARVVERALRDAGVEPGQIGLVKAHGTASPSNDQAEARGLQRVFDTPPPITVFKPVIGHTLGACGIVELILFYQSLIANRAPVLGNPYPIDAAYNLRFISPGETVAPGVFLLNYLAFGGNNTALVIGNV